ncbi:hypothetical protein FACS1894110_09370 [Spirochaetia bacterium]|nr:hypothetical protein FACS1894110_09370 [Spirochaetia bacterium]
MASFKQNLFSAVCILVLFSGATKVFANGVKEEPKAEEAVTLPGPPYYVADDSVDGEKKVVAVFLPEGNSLAVDEERYLSVIQQQLNSGFSKYSGLTLSDEQNMEKIQDYIQKTLSRGSSEDSGIDVGVAVAAGYAVNGSITKLENGKFLLSLTITDIETAVPVPGATYTANVTLWDITNFVAVNNALADLLPKMGVKLTESGVANLTAVSSAARAQQDLERALAEQAKGNNIAALFYAASANESDATLSRAKELEADAIANIEKTAGSAILQDYQKQQAWKKNLEEFEQFFLDHPPFTLYFDPVAHQAALTDYSSGTADFSFKVSLRQTGLNAMQKVMDSLIKGLNNTRKRTPWGFKEWPVISASSTKDNQIPTDILKNYQSYHIVAGFYCDDTQVDTVEFDMYFQLARGSFDKIVFDSTEQRTIYFKGIDLRKLDALGGEQLLSIQIVSINGKDVNISNQEDYIQTIGVSRIPGKRNSTLSKSLRTIPELPEEIEARLTREAAMSEKERVAAGKKEERARRAEAFTDIAEKFSLKKFRFGVNGAYAYPSTFLAGAELGYKIFSIEGHYRFLLDSYNEEAEGDMNSAFGFSIGASKVFDHVIGTFAVGATDYIYSNNFIFIPNLQLRFDILPIKWGPSIRLGYVFEVGAAGMGEMAGPYFTRPGAYNMDGFMVGHSFIAGVGFWL